MSHIFGLAHDFGGLIDQAAGLFGLNNPQQPPVQRGFFDIVPEPGGVVDSFFGSGTGTASNFSVNAAGGTACSTGCQPKTKRYITTVCPNGQTTTREAKSRRRKKRLATVSDIKDLASLKTVLGGGKAFESWIATRGR